MKYGVQPVIPKQLYYNLKIATEIVCFLMFLITGIIMLSSKQFKRYPYPLFAFALLATASLFFNNID